MPSVVRGSDNFDSDIHQGIGVNQTWQDVTASRSAGVTYTNNTGKPIVVQLSANWGSIYTYAINGLTFTIKSPNDFVSITLIIPDNNTYSISGFTSSADLWSELR